MIDLKQYGYIETEKPADGLIPARITAVHRDRYDLISENGAGNGKLKTSVYYGREPHPFPTVGDFVLIKEVDGGDCQIVQTLPRKSYFSRMDPKPGGYTEQAVAANFDIVFIMQSLNQNFNLRRLERYLTLTWQSGATPVIILTKEDLIDDPAEQLLQVEEIAAGVDIITTSAKTGVGLDALGKYLQPGKTCVFLGSSGVGKSSLLNTLMGEEVMLVKEIREDDARGRHTNSP
ncbi:MAG: GTPase RsgA [Oscillospiraceae bacterium]|nr:GTPase RsgA [Oscillospiraceae bacterium]